MQKYGIFMLIVLTGMARGEIGSDGVKAEGLGIFNTVTKLKQNLK